MSDIDVLDIMDIFFGGGQRDSEALHVKDDGHISFSYRGEVDCRRKLAQLAYAYGWDVEEEVVVPGWGRIDIVLREHPGATPRLIELKLDLTKPAKVRRAFQQCDGYGRWWAREKGESCNTVLVGCDVDSEVIAPVAAAYPEVGWSTAARLMDSLATWGSPSLHRQTAARGRVEELRRQLAVHEKAIANMQSAPPEPTPPPASGTATHEHLGLPEASAA